MAEPDVVTLRPRRARLVCAIAAAAVVVVFTLVGTALSGPTGEGPGAFRAGDRAAMVGLGVLFALGIFAVGNRPRLRADARGVRVRNIVGGYDLPWTVVRAVRFERGASWASLELEDDDVVTVLALQAADKEYAVEGVRALRALHAAARVPDARPG